MAVLGVIPGPAQVKKTLLLAYSVILMGRGWLQNVQGLSWAPAKNSSWASRVSCLVCPGASSPAHCRARVVPHHSDELEAA